MDTSTTGISGTALCTQVVDYGPVDLSGLTAAVNSAQAQVASVTSKVLAATAAFTQAQAAEAACWSALADAENALMLAQKAVTEHQASQPPQTITEKDANGRPRQVANPAYTEWKRRLTQLQEQLSAAQRAVDTARLALDKAKEAVAYAQTTLGTAKAELQRARTDLETAKNRLQTAKEQAEKRRCQLEQQQALTQQQREELRNLEEQLRQAEAAMTAATAQIEAAGEAMATAKSAEVVEDWSELTPAQLDEIRKKNLFIHNDIAAASPKNGIDVIDPAALFRDADTQKLLGLNGVQATWLGALIDEQWAEVTSSNTEAGSVAAAVEMLDTAADLISPHVWAQVAGLEERDRNRILAQWQGSVSFGDMVAAMGQKLVGNIPDGAVVKADGSTYVYDAKHGAWLVDDELVTEAPPFEQIMMRNAGTAWLQATINTFGDDATMGWCGATAWAAVTSTYLSNLQPGTPEYQAALKQMQKMGLGMASPERILHVFGGGAAYGIGDDLIQGQFHAWNNETQAGSYYSQFLSDPSATIPPNAQAALALLLPGDVLVTDHKKADFTTDSSARLADHIIGVQSTQLCPQSPYLAFFTSFEGNAGAGIVPGPYGTPELRTDNLTPVNKQYMLVPVVENGTVTSWGAYSVQLPLVVNGQTQAMTLSQMIDANLITVSAATTPQDVIERIDTAIAAGGFPGGPVLGDFSPMTPGRFGDQPNPQIAEEALKKLGIYGANLDPGQRYTNQTKLTIAVGAFQQRWNAANPDSPLPTDGALDSSTWKALASAATGADEAQSFLAQGWTPIQGWAPAAFVAHTQLRNNISTDVIDGRLEFKPTTYGSFVQQQLACVDQGSLARNQFSPQVELVQDILIDIGIMPDTYHNGWFGTLTQRSVEQFQTEHGLASTGVVDPETRDALVVAATTHRAVASAPSVDALDSGLRELAAGLGITVLNSQTRAQLVNAAVDAAVGEPQDATWTVPEA